LSDDHAPGSGPEVDPLQMAAAALRELWLFGSAALGSFATQGGGPRRMGAGFAPYLDPWIRLAATVRDLVEETVGGGIRSDLQRDSVAAGRSEFGSLVSQVNLVAFGSGFRYWRRLAEILASHQSGALQSALMSSADSSSAGREQRTAMDELRAYIREVGDAALQEARTFQLELDRIAASVANATEASEHSPEYHRRWRAKL
jgi:hypothetical protein